MQSEASGLKPDRFAGRFKPLALTTFIKDAREAMTVQISNTINIPRAERDIFGRLESALQWIGNDIVAAIKRYLDDENINVEGDIKKSLNAQVDMQAGQIVLRVGPNVKHAIFRHEGTKPHWAPIGPLRNWVVKKLGFTGKEAEQVAYQIQWNIAEEGTEGKPFMLAVYQQYKPKIVRNLVARMGWA